MLIERIEVICYFILLIRKHSWCSRKLVESFTKRANKSKINYALLNL
jgi:hypothetical protein